MSDNGRGDVDRGPRHVPMGAMWSMPVDVACSLMVTTAGIGFSSGQCPLDQTGAVLHPGDAVAQADFAAGLVDHCLSLTPETPHAALMVVYHLAADEASLGRVLAPFKERFPGAVLAPVRLPHFYYPGMTIEVDLFASSAPPGVRSARVGGVDVSAVAAGPVTLASLSASTGDPVDALAALDLVPDQLLAAHWSGLESAVPPELLAGPGSTIASGMGTGHRQGILVFAPEPVTVSTTPGGAIMRSSGRIAWLATRSSNPDLSAAATEAMDALALDHLPGIRTLKATTRYVGGPTPDDLHGNLAVRHARFPRPGPASTGVPVAALSDATLTIDMLVSIESWVRR